LFFCLTTTKNESITYSTNNHLKCAIRVLVDMDPIWGIKCPKVQISQMGTAWAIYKKLAIEE